MAKDHPFGKMFEEFEGLLGDLFSTRLVTTPAPGSPLAEPKEVSKYTPTSDLRGYSSTSDDAGMTLLVDLPGVDPKALRLSVKDDLVVVSGPTREGKTFTNRYKIARDFDTRTVTASWQHGQLTVKVSWVRPTEGINIPIELK